MGNIDSELPELADALKLPKFTSLQRSESSSSNSRSLKIHDPELKSDDELKTSNITQKANKDDAREMRRKRLEALSASAVKKKRVLQPRSDNPFLRPLGCTGDMHNKLLETTPKARLRKDKNIVEVQKEDVFSDTDGEEQLSEEESDGMSNFIVDDDESLGEEDSEMEMVPPPPRSARRLVRGRRQAKEEMEETGNENEDLEIKMKRLDIATEEVMSGLEDLSDEDAISSKESDCEVRKPEKVYDHSTTRKTKVAEDGASMCGSDAEEMFTKQS
jgi:hypothetical protein